MSYSALTLSAQVLLAGDPGRKDVKAPVLSYSFPSLSWTYTGPNPPIWSIQESDNGISGWLELDTTSGSSRTAIPLDHGVFMRVVGLVSSGGAAVTKASNAVTVD